MTQEEQKALEEKGKEILDEEEKEGQKPEASPEGEEESGNEPEEQDIKKSESSDEDSELAKYKKAVQDTVAQLKEERKKRQLAEAGAMTPGKEEKPEEIESDDIDKKVLSALKKEKEEQAKVNRQKALQDFWKKHPEYDPDNDITGVRSDTLHRVMRERFNTSNSYSYEDIMRDYEDAYFYLNRDKKTVKKEVDTSQLASESQVPAKEGVDTKSSISPEERKLAREMGIDDKRFLELKAKYPDVVSSIK